MRLWHQGDINFLLCKNFSPCRIAVLPERDEMGLELTGAGGSACDEDQPKFTDCRHFFVGICFRGHTGGELDVDRDEFTRVTVSSEWTRGGIIHHL